MVNPFERKSFLNWIMDIPDHDTEKWEMWHNRSEENQRFAKLVRVYLSRMQNIKTELPPEQAEALWHKIETSIYKTSVAKDTDITIPQPSKARVRSINYKWRIAIAASIIMLISIGIGWYSQNVAITADKENYQSCMLPDGSEVKINAGGAIHYNKLAWNFRRRLSLTGEAFFVVKKGKKFTVQCPSALVSVLGTSFNIKAQTNYFRAECYTGRVQVVIPAENYQRVITRNQSVTASNNQKVAFSEFNENDQPAWLNGDFYFTRVPFGIVLEEIENQFNVQIINKPQDDNLLFTGYFNNKDLQKALNYTLTPMGYTCAVEGSIVTLSKPNDE